MKTKAETETEVRVDDEDLDDVIEIASRMMMDEEESLSLDELREVGRDLDIPEEYLDRARKELEVQRAEERKAERRALEEKKSGRLIVASVAALLTALLLGWIGFAHSALSTLHAELETARAQVENVRERQADIEKLYEERAASPDRDAELIGAQNRVRVETKRYSELAAKYNARAAGLAGGVATALTSLPGEVPVSP